MRRHKLYPLVALLMGALAPQAARAQLSDTTWVRPAMMLLVDTSGSMERKPDTSSCIECLPSCSNNPATDERNRWAITLEALTGSIGNYSCTRVARSTYTGQFDEDYFLPHYDFPTLAATQQADGMLDSYRTRLKFGLMTFDGVSTTVDGATLVPWSSYNAVKSKILGMEGQYSFPDAVANPDPSGSTPASGAYGWKPLSFPGCQTFYGINAGARGEGTAPGSLVSVGSSDDVTDISTVNAKIQSSLLQVRPYAGTPIAAMLDDLRYYLNNNTDINTSDPYYQCRDRYAVLLTDGAPDPMFRGGSFQCDSTNNSACAPIPAGAPGAGTNVCQCPYDTEISLAGKLRSADKLKALWVVAFNVNDTDALASLDNIALAGGGMKASRVDDAAKLRTDLDTIFGQAQPESTSRSVPVIINTGRAVMLNGGKQFQITAGFKVSPTGDTPWQGRLWRQRIECSGTSAVAQPIDTTKGDAFHVTLNSMTASQRKILTVKPTVASKDGTVYKQAATSYVTSAKTNVLKPDGSNFGVLSESETANAAQSTTDVVSATPAAFDATIDPAYFDNTTTTRNAINDFVRGNPDSSFRGTHKLGDIYHSNPAVIPPIFPGTDLFNTYDPQLRSFYMNLIDGTKSGGQWGHYDGTYGRPGVVFVATNDGLLHAFNLDDWYDKAGTKYAAGAEFWAFLPPSAFGMMKSVAAPTHQFVFDGTPVIKDLITDKTSTTTTVKTVLLVALRGLPSYIALDVTWPESPNFLWQRTFPYLGESVGTPALANVMVKWNGSDQIRAVAIRPGGQGVSTGTQCTVTSGYLRGKAPNTGARDNVRCWGVRGRSLYVVDVETGELIQEFDVRHFSSAVNGSVAVDGDGLALTRAAYFTDADGVLYRLSMMNTDPSKWRVAPIWDIYGGSAVDFGGNVVTTTSPDWKMGRTATFPPLLNRDPVTGNLTIIVGTGDVDNLSDTTANRVVSINETRKVDTYGELYGGALTANWVLQLDSAESVTGPLVALNDVVYFTSFTGPGSTTNKCTIGQSRVVGGYIRKASNGLPLPGLAPEDSGANILQYRPKDATTAASLLMGLSLARDPVCIDGSTVNDPLNTTNPGRIKQTGQAGGGTFTLRSMVGGKGGDMMSGTTGSEAQREYTRTLPVPTVARSVGWASSIE
ncbi:MAG TPA: hypothetical protein VI299_19580 [Polyangiales bacterium]